MKCTKDLEEEQNVANFEKPPRLFQLQVRNLVYLSAYLCCFTMTTPLLKIFSDVNTVYQSFHLRPFECILLNAQLGNTENNQS